MAVVLTVRVKALKHRHTVSVQEVFHSSAVSSADIPLFSPLTALMHRLQPEQCQDEVKKGICKKKPEIGQFLDFGFEK